ncbi:MAG: hypothetical protein ACTSWY_12935 [Promethearchaeota archaeon]
MFNSEKTDIITLIVIIFSWIMGSQLIFMGEPALITQSRISQNIAWEFEHFKEENYNYTQLIFHLKCEIWINNPFPLLNSYTGAYLSPKLECLIENTTFLTGKPVTNIAWPIMPIYRFSMPGNQIYSESVGISFDSSNITEVPKGIYVFWVEFNKNFGSEGILQYYRTYMNVTENGIIITSDEIPNIWGEFLSSSLIFTGLLIGIPTILYLVLEMPIFKKFKDKSVIKDKPTIKNLEKKRNLNICIELIIGFFLGGWLLHWPYGPFVAAITAVIIDRVFNHFKDKKIYPTKEFIQSGIVIGICIGLIISLLRIWSFGYLFIFLTIFGTITIFIGGICGGMFGLIIGKSMEKRKK